MNGQNPMDDFEARLRETLRREGDQIRPTDDGLDRIRARVAEPTRRRTWMMAGVVGLATATAIAGAFFVSGDLLNQTSDPDTAVPPAADSSEPTPSPTPEPTDSPTPTPTPSPTQAESAPAPPPTADATPTRPPQVEMTVPVYYLGETTSGPRLFREFHAVESADPPPVTALNEMFGAKPSDPDYGSPWAPGSRARSVDPSGDAITVDLSREVLQTQVPRATADLMVQQLVYTVQATLQDATTPVRILVEGEPVSDISGAPTAEPLVRADAAEVQALTWITAPTQGATVSRTFEVEGIANAFEANVNWQLVRDGDVVRDGFATAQEGQTFSPYSFRIRGVAPGDYTLKVFQESAEDGSETFLDTKQITVE